MGDNLYYTVATGGTGVDNDEWTEPKPVLAGGTVGVGSADRPALASFQGRLWCVHRGPGNDVQLYWTSFKYATPGAQDGGWSVDAPISNQLSGGAPALAVFNDQLWCEYEGGSPSHSNPDLYYTFYDSSAGEWSNGQVIPNQMSDSGPALAVFQGQLWCVYRGGSSDVNDDNPQLYYTIWDGKNWSNAVSISNQMSNRQPALAVFNNQLWCAYHGGAPSHDNPHLYYTVCNGYHWTDGQPITDEISGGGPTLVYDTPVKELVCMWTGNEAGLYNQLRYSNRKVANSQWPTARTVSTPTEGVECYSELNTGPALAEFQFIDTKQVSYDMIMCVYRNSLV